MDKKSLPPVPPPKLAPKKGPTRDVPSPELYDAPKRIVPHVKLEEECSLVSVGSDWCWKELPEATEVDSISLHHYLSIPAFEEIKKGGLF